LLAKRAKFDSNSAQFVAAQLALYIASLPLYKIVHRSLRPKKVLVKNDGYIVVLPPLEFGNSINFDECAPYFAPEVFSGDSTDLADWWTLGILICMIITGANPFDSGNTAADRTIEAIMSGKPTLPESLAEAARDLISQV
jgi:serine/threonine protein kinase